MSESIIFEDPAPPRRGGKAGRSALGLWLASLRDHPGQWAKNPRRYASQAKAGGLATSIARGKGYGVAAGEYEATTRKATDGEGGAFMYVRYVGGAK